MEMSQSIVENVVSPFDEPFCPQEEPDELHPGYQLLASVEFEITQQISSPFLGKRKSKSDQDFQTEEKKRKPAKEFSLSSKGESKFPVC